MTIYLNLDSDEVYTEEEVMECYDRDVAQLIADNPAAQLPTYDEWLEEYRDLGLLELSIDECIDEIWRTTRAIDCAPLPTPEPLDWTPRSGSAASSYSTGGCPIRY